MSVRIYVAGPLGFSAPGRLYMDYVLMPALSGAGYAAVDPFKLTPDHVIEDAKRTDNWQLANQFIFRNNVDAIDAAAAVVAVLDGTDVDSGTASEIGYAYAKKKAVFGLRTDFRQAGDNPGSVVNLQVQGFLTGGLFADLSGLIQALKQWVISEANREKA